MGTRSYCFEETVLTGGVCREEGTCTCTFTEKMPNDKIDMGAKTINKRRAWCKSMYPLCQSISFIRRVRVLATYM